MSKSEYTIDEMIDCLHNPQGKRSLAELDDVIDEIMARNPDFVKRIEDIINEQTSSKTGQHLGQSSQ